MPDAFDDLDSLDINDDDDLASVAQLFRTVRGAATPDELRNETTIVAAMADVAINAPGTLRVAAPVSRARRIGPKMAVRLAAVGAVVLVGASAAAATGQLPDDAQSFVARTTSHLGLRLPDPDSDEPTHESTAPTQITTAPPLTTPTAPSTNGGTTDAAGPRATSETRPNPQPTAMTDPISSSPGPATPAPSSSTDDVSPIGPDPTGPAKHGLCQAWRAHQSNPSNADQNAVSMARLLAAAADLGLSVEEFCADVLGTESEPAVPTSPPPPPAEEENGKSAQPDKAKKADDAPPGHSSPTPDTKKDKEPHK